MLKLLMINYFWYVKLLLKLKYCTAKITQTDGPQCVNLVMLALELCASSFDVATFAQSSNVVRLSVFQL